MLPTATPEKIIYTFLKTMYNEDMSKLSNPATAPADSRYADLYKRIVEQGLINQFRGIPGLFVKQENFVNAIKEYISQGLPASVGFDPKKALDIGDFNPADAVIKSSVYQLTQIRQNAQKIPVRDLVKAFTKSGTAEAFTSKRIRMLRKAMEFDIFTDTVKVLTGQGIAKLEDTRGGAKTTVSDAIPAITYDSDATFITTDANDDKQVLKQLKKARDLILSFGTPSNTHTAFGKANATFIYSASPSDLVILYNTAFKTKINDVTARLFNKDDVLLKIQSKAIDFAKVIDTNEANKIDFIIMDKQAIIKGFALDETSIVKLPRAQFLHELFYWYGFARLPNFPIYKFSNS